MVETKREPAGEGLPDGWLKEYRPRKPRPGSRFRRDKFYIDPTNSYEFRSLKEVHHYLESQDTSDSVVTPKKKKIEDLQVSGNKSQHAGRPSSEPEGVSKGRLADLELQVARKNDQRLNHESAAREEANVEPKPKGKKQKTEPVKQIAAPVRSSPRLTALKRNEEANNVPRDPLVDAQTDIADQVQPTEQVKNPKSKAISSPVIQNKDGAHAPSTSGNAEDKYPSAPEQILGASAACSLTEVGRQNAHAPPQQNGLVGTADAMPGYSLSSLFRSIWSDPCLEFAFRTLTGDLPVLDNNLAVANYFLPPQDSNKGTVPPNCSSSSYDGARKNHGQVDSVRLPMPMPMPRPSDKLYSSGWFPPQ
ncbi:hypothetical protein VPH35_030901 [Triticum aestivum]|uniref:MBD domain-containing protein n=3 Tax=Triticum TaxID=4564 RepID=A0A9R1RRN8_TRITD|nr:methyl-CpG-binding domain-containing protein 13 isoform X2 [Triticum aestivum]XP_044325766.1 methyl-CpG-binding domain-containing protein 13 isoform X2 [Triticum aestivum]VAH50981.1 unnamed protein product [Triticum turgidum subsp. durum]